MVNDLCRPTGLARDRSPCHPLATHPRELATSSGGTHTRASPYCIFFSLLPIPHDGHFSFSFSFLSCDPTFPST